MRFLFVVHKNEEKAEQNSVLFHRLTLKERGLRPNGYFPLMRQPLLSFPLTAPSRSSQCLVVKIQDAMCVYDNLGITILRDLNPASPRHSQLCIVDAFSATEITFAPLRYQLLFHDKNRRKACHTVLSSAL